MCLCSVASHLSNSKGSAGTGYVCFCLVAGCDHKIDGGRGMSVCACLLVHCGQLQHASMARASGSSAVSKTMLWASSDKAPFQMVKSLNGYTDKFASPLPAGSREPQEGKATLPQKGPLKPIGILGSVLPKPVARTVGPKMVKFRSNVQELGLRVSWN